MEFEIDDVLKVVSYKSESFRDVADSPLGLQLWDWLRRADNVIRMETAVFFERPAVEPIGPFLFKQFGEQVKEDRVKQSIGHMVRQILESIGYEHVKYNEQIKNNMFCSGSTYSKKGMDE